MRNLLLISAIIATLSLPVSADSNGTLGTPDTVLSSSTIDFSPTVFDHAGPAGSSGNSTTGPTAFAGGFTANQVTVSGIYEENPASTATISSEADIDFSGPLSFTYAHPFASGPGPSAWSATQTITPVDPAAGAWDLEFIDTFDDNDPATVDATTTDLVVTFEDFGGGTPNMDTSGIFTLGSLGPGVGTFTAGSVGEFLLADIFDTYTLTLNSPGVLDFVTDEDPGGISGGDTVDTEIAIFDGTGVQIAYSDDDGPGLYSAIIGEPLAAGSYSLVVSGFGSNISSAGTVLLPDVTGGTSTGDYVLDVALTKIPEPSMGLLIYAGLVGMGLGRRS